jgi:hypothetical protein
MALVTDFTCTNCRQPRHEVVTPSRVCSACRIAITRADTLAHMAKLLALPIDERVRRIELALYQLDADSRLRALEAANARY